jgi:ATP-dependent helicase HrpB
VTGSPRHDQRTSPSWRDLPAMALREPLRDAMRDPGAAVIVAPTGSGKTTGIPLLLAEDPSIRGRIVVLQPRRLATRVTAQRVADLLGAPLGGDEVGFATRHERAITPRTRIRFLTEGLFLRQMLERPDLDGIGAVVLDEFHERSLDADLLFGLVRSLRSNRRDLRFVVMSATLAAEPIAAALGAPILSAATRSFPVEVEYAERTSREDPEERAAQAVRAVLEGPARDAAGDLLIFMPGVREIARTIDRLKGVSGSLREPLDVLPLHGQLSPAEQDRALRSSPHRKAIVATNVAETSITIEGIRTVIDAGLARVHRRHPQRPLDALRLEATSRATSDQRAGRAGRTAPGRCVRLWTEAEHLRRPEHPDPEVKRVDLAAAVLLLHRLGFADPRSFPWLEAPDESSLEGAERTLRLVGAIDSRGEATSDGRRMASLPVHPRLGRVLLEAAARGVVDRAARCAAILSERELFPPGRTPDLAAFDRADDPPSDLFRQERLLESFMSSGDRTPMPASIDRRSLRDAAFAARQIERACGDLSGRETNSGTSEDLAVALVRGFPDHLARKPDRLKPHGLMPGRRRVRFDRDCVLVEDSLEGAALSLSIREAPGEAGDTLLSMATRLAPEWLLEALPDAVEERRDLVWNARLGAVEEREQTLVAGIEIDETIRPPRSPESIAAASAMLAERIESGEASIPGWSEAVDAWLDRVRCVASWFPERGLPNGDEDSLRAMRRAIALEAGAVRVKDLEGLDVLAAIEATLSREDASFVRAMTPERLAMPSGFRMKVEYQPGQPPRGRARIQDLIGMTASPAVAGGRVPVLLEILAPNQRPIQVTSDLASFWRDLYPRIRGELSRRYPRHRWPS